MRHTKNGIESVEPTEGKLIVAQEIIFEKGDIEKFYPDVGEDVELHVQALWKEREGIVKHGLRIFFAMSENAHKDKGKILSRPVILYRDVLVDIRKYARTNGLEAIHSILRRDKKSDE